jgi:hypothetical protein
MFISPVSEATSHTFRINILEIKAMLICPFMLTCYCQFTFTTTKELCFLSSGSAPCSKLTSIRVMTLCTSLLAYVLIQAYGATLMSHKTAVISWEPSFNNLEGLLQSKNSLAVVSGSDIHSELKVRRFV